MASLYRSVLLSRALRALSFHPPIHKQPQSPLLQRDFSFNSISFLPPRRPKYPDTLSEHQHLYSIGYPQGSLDDLSPPCKHVDAMSLPPPLTLISVGGQTESASMTNPDQLYIQKRHSETSYSCDCMAWIVAKGKAPDARSCKHLRALLGDAHENARCDESKTTKVFTPETNPINIKKKARDEALAAQGLPPPNSSKPTKKRPSASLLDSSSTATSTNSAPKRARQASSTSKAKKSSLGETPEVLTDPDEARSDGSGGRDLLLAHKFDLDGKIDPKGWWVSEKLDGIRAYWDGQTTLWSRNGKALSAPKDFLEQLPRGRTLDGELYIGRNRFDETSGIVRSLHSPRWDEIKYMVFDVPYLAASPFEDRLSCLESFYPSLSLDTVEKGKSQVKSPVVLVEHKICEGLDDLKKRLKEVQDMGGEGLMLRQPGSLYVSKRSKTLLKVKTFYDAEAKVIGYEPGKGKYEGMTGSLVCQMQDEKTTFSVGSGLTDQRRQFPPAIGSIITYRFFELTKQNIPRFPSFVGERIEMDTAQDAQIRKKDLVAGKSGETEGSSKSKGKGKKKKA